MPNDIFLLGPILGLLIFVSNPWWSYHPEVMCSMGVFMNVDELFKTPGIPFSLIGEPSNAFVEKNDFLFRSAIKSAEGPATPAATR